MTEEDTGTADLSRLAEQLSRHAGTRLEHTRIILYEKFSVAFVRIVSKRISLQLLLLFCFFLSVTGGLWIGRHYDDYVLGFGLVTLLYLLLYLVYILLRKPIFEKKMLDAVVTVLCAEKENDDDDDDEA